MFTRSRTRPARPRIETDFHPGAYLTDGRRLFRVISQFAPQSTRVFAALEDCRTLDVRPYSPDELYAMRLRRVFCGE